jgi:hypothetical protein
LILQALNRLFRAPKHKRTTLMLSFEDKNQFKLQQLLEEFSLKKTWRLCVLA